MSATPFSTRYTNWLDRWRMLIWGASFAIAAIGFFLATKLPIRSDMSSLLPPSTQSVRDLEVLKSRARVFGTVFLDVGASDPAIRAQAAAYAEQELRKIDPSLIGRLSTNDGALARYLYQHRFLFIDLGELTKARDSLADQIRVAKLKANPLYVPLDEDEPTAPEQTEDELAKLEEKLAELKAKATAPLERVSKDGKLQLFMITAAFPTSDNARGKALVTAVTAVADATKAKFGSTVETHLTGTVTMTLHEHDSVIVGMGLAIAVTILLCAIALILYYRSLLAVGALMWALTVGVAMTFGLTYLVIGQLNMMSAFLTSIVVGNGINPGMILLARYLEALRSGESGNKAVSLSIAGATRGTLAASLTAAVAYASLLITDFRGFRHFGIIAGIGMVMCWVTAFTLLPALLLVLSRRNLVKARKEPALGRVLQALMPRSLKPLIAIALIAIAGSLVASAIYIIGDPFATNWRMLQSDGAKVLQVRRDDQRLLENFDRKLFLGSVYQVVFVAASQADTVTIAQRLRDSDNARSNDAKMFLEIISPNDLIPAKQAEKIAILNEIRVLMADPGFEELDEEQRKRIDNVRPPDNIALVTDRDVPAELGWFFTEKDGSYGKLVVARGAGRLDTWNVRDRLDYAAAIRQVDVPPGTAIGGEALIVADVVTTMERDTPCMILIAIVGSILAVWLLLRRRRAVVITLVCAAGGIAAMIAVCAALGMKVHFLDVIALPITVGIGIDYAVNLVARDMEEGGRMSAKQLIGTTGGAVVMCSYTTLVGYGSLLLSTNGGIRSFGLAAVIGEVTCVVFGVLLAPALLQQWKSKA